MRIVFGDLSLGVQDGDRRYIFSYAQAGLESLVKEGVEWMYRAPRPSFWRASTDNDRGNGFSLGSACWLGADLYIKPSAVRAEIDGTALDLSSLKAPGNNALMASPLREADFAQISFTYLTATDPEAEVEVVYKAGRGRLGVSYEYRGRPGLPGLPVAGLRFVLPCPVSGYCYRGLSGETYPDRKAGAVKGRYHVKGMPVTPYIVPQECGMHMDTEELKLSMRSSSLTIAKLEKPFGFSLLPYTAVELECAMHQDELPPVRRSVLLIAAAVRGVGGINSWGAAPEARYELDASAVYRTSFVIE